MHDKAPLPPVTRANSACAEPPGSISIRHGWLQPGGRLPTLMGICCSTHPGRRASSGHHQQVCWLSAVWRGYGRFTPQPRLQRTWRHTIRAHMITKISLIISKAFHVSNKKTDRKKLPDFINLKSRSEKHYDNYRFECLCSSLSLLSLSLSHLTCLYLFSYLSLLSLFSDTSLSLLISYSSHLFLSLVNDRNNDHSSSRLSLFAQLCLSLSALCVVCCVLCCAVVRLCGCVVVWLCGCVVVIV